MKNHKAAVICILLSTAMILTVSNAGATDYQFVLSSGIFGIPQEAKSVDWAVVNDSPNDQSIRVTVYKCVIGTTKTAVAPGAVTTTLKPGQTSHNANSVGTVFTKGMLYEVVLETNDRRVLPSVMLWVDQGGTYLPGTLIPAGSFISIK